MIDLFDNEARSIAQLYRKLNRALDRELSPLGLSHGRYLYLFGLYLEDGRSQQSLADALAFDKAAVTRALCRLEQDGFVERRRNPDDRRVTSVYLTEHGRMLRPQMESALTTAIRDITGHLPEAKGRQLRQLLRLACSVE